MKVCKYKEIIFILFTPIAKRFTQVRFGCDYHTLQPGNFEKNREKISFIAKKLKKSKVCRKILKNTTTQYKNWPKIIDQNKQNIMLFMMMAVMDPKPRFGSKR